MRLEAVPLSSVRMVKTQLDVTPTTLSLDVRIVYLPLSKSQTSFGQESCPKPHGARIVCEE